MLGTSTPVTTRGWVAVALGLTALVVAGCSGGTARSSGGELGSSVSSPFSVGTVPTGYELVVAGMGTRVGDWGEDSTGTVEPYTVLSPDGRATGEEVVRVALTGYEDYQGGLLQASLGYVSEHTVLTIDGHEAVFAPEARDASGQRWADLVVVRGDDLAVRVSSPRATQAELTAIARRVVVPEDRREAPTVSDPPGGLRVVGSVNVDGVVAATASVAPHTNQVPGPPSAHAAGWVLDGFDETDRLAVVTVPGRSIDLAAVAVRERSDDAATRTTRFRTVGERRGLIIDDVWEGSAELQRSLLVESSWGDIVVVRATGQHVPTEDELVAIASSVKPTDDATWEQFTTEANGGPGVHPDVGRHELARGRIGEIDWLLQDGPPSGGMSVAPQVGPSLRGIDPCLKLSNGQRACADRGSGTAGEDSWYAFVDNPTGLSFVVLTTPSEAAYVWITTSTATASAALVAVPAGGVWGAVVFVAAPGLPTCASPADTPAPGQMRVEILDDDGEVLECLFSRG